MSRKFLLAAFIAFFVAASCKKTDDKNLRYFEVGIKDIPADWRDSSFIIATSNTQLISEIQSQLNLPVNQRKIVLGTLKEGNAGYNKNGTHPFKWHFSETEWQLTDFSIEIYDGRPYSDVDSNLNYWLDTVKRFSPWNSYIKREIIR